MVQGLGNVGRNLALFLAEEGASIVAVSDSSGGVHNPAGLDVQAAVEHKRRAPERSRASRAASPSRTRSSSCWTATSSPPARSSR